VTVLNTGTHRFNDFVDHSNTGCYLVFRVSNDKTVEVFLGVVSELVGARLALLHATLASNADFSPAIALHFLQAVASRADEQTEEVDLRELFDRNVNLLRGTLGALLLVVFNGRPEVRVIFHCPVDETDALVLELFAVTDFSSVGSTTMRIICWGRRRRAATVRQYICACKKSVDIPLSFRRNEVIQSQFAIDFFQAQMNGVVVKLRLRYTSGRNGGRQAGYFSFCLTPATPAFARCRIN